MSNKEILIIHETIAESVISDLVTLGTLSTIIALSVYIFESEAMQWVGAIIFFIWLLSRASEHRKGMGYRTAQELANYLSKKYGVIAKDGK